MAKKRNPWPTQTCRTPTKMMLWERILSRGQVTTFLKSNLDKMLLETLLRDRCFRIISISTWAYLMNHIKKVFKLKQKLIVLSKNQYSTQKSKNWHVASNFGRKMSKNWGKNFQNLFYLKSIISRIPQLIFFYKLKEGIGILIMLLFSFIKLLSLKAYP